MKETLLILLIASPYQASITDPSTVLSSRTKNKFTILLKITVQAATTNTSELIQEMKLYHPND
jgi:hypothetical protein